MELRSCFAGLGRKAEGEAIKVTPKNLFDIRNDLGGISRYFFLIFLASNYIEKWRFYVDKLDLRWYKIRRKGLTESKNMKYLGFREFRRRSLSWSSFLAFGGESGCLSKTLRKKMRRRQKKDAPTISSHQQNPPFADNLPGFSEHLSRLPPPYINQKEVPNGIQKIFHIKKRLCDKA